MMRLILATCVTLLLAGTASAHGRHTHRCEVSAADISHLSSEDEDEGIFLKIIGRFETVISEEELTTRTYPLPGTDLFVIPSVFYTDEVMGTERSLDSASLRLEISRRPKSDYYRSLQFASSEVMLDSFDLARVTTIFRRGRRAFMVVMECRYQGDSIKK
jgi:hypothetical protein